MDRRTLFVDVDDTLLCHDLSQFPKEHRITVECNGRSFDGVPNLHNVKLLIKFYKLGYEVIVWSKTGKSWAQAVVRALGIEKYVDSTLSKPDFYLDDKDVNYWMGPRLYRDPHTGKECA